MDDVKQRLLDAALIHVAFDGWSADAFRAAQKDADVDPTLAKAVCPRGALDLAVAYHKRGDAAMVAALDAADLSTMRIRERIAYAIRARIEVTEKEAVRRGTVLFALPQHAPEGARLIWDTADAMWTALDDTSRDGNWYTKRAILSGVYSSVVLYWLGDETDGATATWDFVDRRIENVMQIEKLKAGLRENPFTRGFAALGDRMMGMLKAPTPRDDLPGASDG